MRESSLLGRSRISNSGFTQHHPTIDNLFIGAAFLHLIFLNLRSGYSTAYLESEAKIGGQALLTSKMLATLTDVKHSIVFFSLKQEKFDKCPCLVR